MRGAGVTGCKEYYRHVLTSSTPQLRRHSLYFSRTFKTTATSRSDTVSQYGLYAKYRRDKAIPPPNPHAREIAVLGGGLTGLSTAFKLSQELPDAKITIFEKSNRLGGWIDSEVVKVDDGEVLFEWGPRTFRVANSAGSFSMLDMVRIDDTVL